MPFVADSTPSFVPDGGSRPQRKGVSKWLFGNRTSAPGMAYEAAANVLNLPSYAIGGMMDEFQQNGVSAMSPLKNPFGIAGALSGIKNKEAVIQELPESFGIDPNSKAGLALGFGGELLTPGLPVGKVADFAGDAFNVFRGGRAASRIAKPNIFERGFSKLGSMTEEGGKTLAMKSLRPSPSQISNFEEISRIPLGDFIKENKLYGSGDVAMQKADELIKPLQDQYNALVRNGQNISPLDYVRELRKRAMDIRSSDFSPEAEMVANALEKRAVIFAQNAKKYGKSGIPIDILTNTKSSNFSKVPQGAMVEPTIAHAGKEAGRAGADVLDRVAPGSREVGRKLRNLREFREIAKKQSGLGKGTQLVNFTKLGGAGTGAFVGGLPGAVVGYVGEQVLRSPGFVSRASNLTGNIGSNLTSNAADYGRAAQRGFNMGKKVIGTGLRTYPLSQSKKRDQRLQESQRSYPQVGSGQTGSATQSTGKSEYINAYGSIPSKKLQYSSPSATLQTNTAFGKSKKVKRGSFY